MQRSYLIGRMSRGLRFSTAAWVCCLAATAFGAISDAPSDLRCEYLTDALAVDTSVPRLSWKLSDQRRGAAQTAFQVVAAATSLRLQDGIADLWDSGKIASDQSHLVNWGGKSLSSRQEVHWKVRIWDQEGQPSGWSRPAQFRVALLQQTDWRGSWITAPTNAAASAAPDPLPLFRRQFEVSKPVRRATAYVCGLGQYELRLDGRRVGERVMDPAWTNYRKECSYATYDLTSQLAAGPHAVGMMLGNGMYNVTGGRYVKFKGSFGPPKLVLQLEMEHEDGTTSIIASDSSWRVTPGPITFSCIFGGEDFDARREMAGWDRPGFNDESWKNAQLTEGPGGDLRPQLSPPITVAETYKSTRRTQPKPGVYVYDLGQNFSGWPKLAVSGAAGAKVKLTPAELLGADGLASQASSGGPTWFSYVLRGSGVETWSPRFSYYGFRYLQVEGAAPQDDKEAGPELPRIQQLGGEFITSSARIAGEFACSKELVNRIHRLILAAIRCNLQSVLTDCPHREKLGWLEVSHLLAGGIIYNFEVPRFYAKVSEDMRQSQTTNGLVPDIAPEYTVFSGGFRDSPEWGSACAFNPWHVYQFYGDASLLARHYDVVQRYVEYLGRTAKDQVVAHGLGDWYDVGPRGPGESQLTSKGLTATAIYYGDLQVLARAAALLSKPRDAERYAALSEKVRSAFNKRFFRPTEGLYDRGSQTAQAMSLVLGLVEEQNRQAVLDQLARTVITNGTRVTAGDVGFTYLVHALTDGGRDDLLYSLVCQTNGPGYADQLRKGATTLTEAWDANPASSQNHCMLGHAEEWFYSGLAGIRPDPAAAGFKRTIIKPAVVGDLRWVKAHHDSPFGRIRSEWATDGGRFSLLATIPPNTTATIILPAAGAIMESDQPLERSRGIRQVRTVNRRTSVEVGAGEYRFRCQLDRP